MDYMGDRVTGVTEQTFAVEITQNVQQTLCWTRATGCEEQR